MGWKRRAAVLALGCLLAVLGSASSVDIAWAQGRKVVLVSPVEDDKALTHLPSSYSADALRRELEVALETTGVFTVASRDAHDLDPVLKEYARSKRRPKDGFRMAQLILNPTLEGFSITERRRRAPMMRGKDSVSVSGLIAMTVEVVNVEDGSVQTRMQIDVPYQTPEHLTDPLPDDSLTRMDAYNSPPTPEEIRGAYEELGRVFAKRVLDQVYPAVVAMRSGDRIYISRGQDAGYRVGDVLRVIRRGAPVTDPLTHETLGYDEQTLGEVKVVETLPKMTIGQIISSTTEPAVGDIVREPVAEPEPRDDN